MADGIIVIDKPSDWTSMDICAKLRGILHERRIGHAGTLDPMATGVLPVFVGRATRAVEFATESGKEYIAGLKLGVITDTQDTTGTVLEERPVSVTAQALEEVLPQFRGDILQVPPMYSALKVDGKKLYQLARKGREVERAPRPITIHALEVVEQTGPDAFTIRVGCSKGTYIRTICHDIGEALGCGGCMSALRRVKAAGFTLADAVTLEQVQAAADPTALLLGVDTYFAAYPALRQSDAAEEKKVRNGMAIPCPAADGTYRVYGPEGDFLALSELKTGVLTTIKSFFEV